MTREVEAFVGRAVAERSASVLVAGPREPGTRLLRRLLEALREQRVHTFAIVGDASAWPESGDLGQLLLRVVECGASVTADQALRSALRQDPDVILCDQPAALELLFTVAETGHQVLAHVPGELAASEAAVPFPLGFAIHLGVELDDAGSARLIRFAQGDQAREVLWDRARPGSLPAQLPGRRPLAPPTIRAPEPLAADVIEVARAALAGQLRSTWLPLLADPGGDAACSKLGGRPMLAPDEAWPTCPSCALALPLALQLRRDDLPAPAAACFPPGAGWLQLFYCDSPSCSCDDPAGPAAANRLLRWLSAAGARPADAPEPLGDVDARSWSPADVHGWREASEGPHSEDLGDLTPEAQDACLDVREQVFARRIAAESGAALLPEPLDDEALEALAGARSGDKLLGWPAWEQGAEWSACPRCGQRRALLFQLDADRGRLTALFAADGRGHVLACPEHPEELAFAWACG